MRTPRLALVLLAACGGGSGDKRDDAPRRDTMQLHDSPPLVACTPVNGNTPALRKIGSTPGSPLLAVSPPNDGRLFIVEREGQIRIFENEQLKPTPFLDMSDVDGFASGGEQGLLGLAFHPDYANNRQFFIWYTTNDADVLARYYVSETDLNKADPAGEIVLSIPDFAGNHNGGMMEFGADGYLYVGTGDGGDGGDPCRNAQAIKRTDTDCPDRANTKQEPLLGKMLRIDVDTTSGLKNYGIPADNPYADGVAGEPEIFMRGLRNPWRWSFDRATGDMYIGDVGQDTDEEVDILTPAQQNGANLGWSQWEAARAFRTGADSSGIFMPQFIRNQTADNWMAVIGGSVYRGTCFPDLVGDYFFTDYVNHQLTRGRFSSGTFTASELPGTWPASPSSLHADARGELFMTTEVGDVYQLEAQP
jgi:glucose/arabinose dehydrogenase